MKSSSSRRHSGLVGGENVVVLREMPFPDNKLPTKDELRAFQHKLERLQMSRELGKAEESTMERHRMREKNAKLQERLSHVTPLVTATRVQDKKVDMIRAKLEIKRQEFNRLKAEKLREEERRYLEWINSTRLQRRTSADCKVMTPCVACMYVCVCVCVCVCVLMCVAVTAENLSGIVSLCSLTAASRRESKRGITLFCWMML
jgi:hypothetical protein